MKSLLRLTLAVLVSLSLATTYAQNEIGVYGFSQISMLSNSDYKGLDVYQPQLTLSGGGGLQFTHYFDKGTYSFQSKWGVMIGAFYSSFNQKFKSEYTIGPIDYTWEGKKRLDYLKFSVLAKYAHPLNRKFQLVGYVGPQISYLVAADGGIVTWLYGDGNPEVGYYDLPPSSEDYYAPFTIDLVIGGGGEFKISKAMSGHIGLRLDHSITSAENVEESYALDIESTSFARAIQLMFGVNFKFESSPLNRTKY